MIRIKNSFYEKENKELKVRKLLLRHKIRRDISARLKKEPNWLLIRFFSMMTNLVQLIKSKSYPLRIKSNVTYY